LPTSFFEAKGKAASQNKKAWRREDHRLAVADDLPLRAMEEWWTGFRSKKSFLSMAARRQTGPSVR
jgi:hypothetical protein